MDKAFHRIFIALPINDDEIIQSLTGAADNFAKYKSILKIVPPINYHITVKFFGQVESSIVESLTKSFMSINQLNAVNYHIDKIGPFQIKTIHLSFGQD